MKRHFLLGILIASITLNGYADTRPPHAPILIFVSFSMPDASIKGWMNEAEIIHAPVVIRGLIHNSFKETYRKMAELSQNNHGGVQLDPTLFERFHIEKVPALVVSSAHPCLPNQTCEEDFDVLYGDVTAEYALTKIMSRDDSVSLIAKEALAQLHEAHHAI